MQITRIIDYYLYPRKAIAEARQAYRDFCTLSVNPLEKNKAQVTITVQPDHEEQGREILMEFLNYLLDLSAQIHINADNELCQE